MGKSRIRQRKWHRRRNKGGKSDDGMGVIDDLHDQAERSSYAQHIPPAGDERRMAIWWNRAYRYYSALRRGVPTGPIRDAYYWQLVALAMGLMAAVISVAALIIWVFGD